MQSPLPLLGALLVASSVGLGCVSSHSIEYSVETPSFTKLETRTLDDGSELSVELRRTNRGASKVDRTVSRPRTVAYLGVSAEQLDELAAAAIGAEPFSGARVTLVADGDPADRAGLRVGDLLLSIGGKAIVDGPSTGSNLVEVIQSFSPGDTVELEIQRPSRVQLEDGVLARLDPMLLTVELSDWEVTESETQSTTLEASELVEAMTGLRAAQLPGELAGELFGDAQGQVLILSVGTGTPAYRAGLRAGDRVTHIDGVAATSLDQLRIAVLARGEGRGYSIQTEEVDPGHRAAPRDEAIEIDVTGALGAYSTTLDVREDLDRRSDVDIPILLEYESSVVGRRWSFLDFIFQFGANYKGRYLPSETREPARYSDFSMLPFGAFEVERSPEQSRYRMFWLINWSSSN